jgi:hypothetical protein
MLNPSSADATVDDPTVRRCIGFSRAWGMGALVVVNLFAFRTPSPGDLSRVDDPVGPENDDAIHDAVVRSRVVVAAWGAERLARRRTACVFEILAGLGRDVRCLGTTKDGSPRHPLYVAASTRPEALP